MLITPPLADRTLSSVNFRNRPVLIELSDVRAAQQNSQNQVPRG